MKLHWKIIISMILGVGVGFLYYTNHHNTTIEIISISSWIKTHLNLDFFITDYYDVKANIIETIAWSETNLNLKFFIDSQTINQYAIDVADLTIIKQYVRDQANLYNVILLLGDLFIRLLKMVIVPLIFTSIVIGVSSIKDRTKIGRMGLKTFLYYVSTSLIAILIGLFLANTIQPGVGASTISTAGVYDTSQLSSSSSMLDILKRMIPTNIISAFTNGDMLAIIFFAVFFGIALSFINSKHSSPIISVIESIYNVIIKMTQIIISCAPIGVFGLMVKAVSNSGLDIFRDLGWYAVTIASGLSIHLFIIMPLILILVVKVSPLIHFKAMASAMVTAFSTSSSSATLPVTMKCVRDNVKVSNETSSFVLPMGSTINMDGTALYECAGVLFIAQALGVPLDAGQQFIVVFTALLASIGAAGIPSAGLVMLFIVTDAVGLQSEAVALWVGSMLAIDRPLDMFRTMVNISSDSVGAAVIAKSEGETLYDE